MSSQNQTRWRNGTENDLSIQESIPEDVLAGFEGVGKRSFDLEWFMIDDSEAVDLFPVPKVFVERFKRISHTPRVYNKPKIPT